MSTRRERIEARLARRRAWRESAVSAASAADRVASSLSSAIPFGQPILVGHHSEGRHRRQLERIDSAMGKACERRAMAERHDSVADTLEHQLATSVYSDDTNATEALAEREAKRASVADWMVAVNAAWRKAKRPDLTAPGQFAAFADANGYTDAERNRIVDALRHRWETAPFQPFPAYAITSYRACARRDAKRREQVEEIQQRTQQAAESGGVVVVVTGEQARVTFAEKPPYATIQALKAARYWWSSGSWYGPAASLPDCVQQPSP